MVVSMGTRKPRGGGAVQAMGSAPDEEMGRTSGDCTRDTVGYIERRAYP
jgi:hypothetical protein